MNKKVLIAIVIILILAIGGTVGYMYFWNPDEQITSYIVPKILEPYIRIQKNEEMSSSDLTLNGENKEMYYYFDIYNYDELTNEYSSLAITPYVKVGIKQENPPENNEEDGEINNISDYVSVNLYYIKDLSLPVEGDNIEEITVKGELGTDFQDYFECKRLEEYSKENDEKNVAHYMAKVTLNTENENYNNLTENITQKLEITLGYRK